MPKPPPPKTISKPSPAPVKEKKAKPPRGYVHLQASVTATPKTGQVQRHYRSAYVPKEVYDMVTAAVDKVLNRPENTWQSD